ncbi:MAG TPA: hypothetical protein VGK73_12065 [Polyangiaceae bacterium]
MEPLSDSAVSSLAVQYARMVAGLELEPGEPLLVLPTGDFFPDRFTGDQASVEGLCARIQGYAALEHVNVQALVVGTREPKAGGGCGPSGCGSGACSTSDTSEAGPRIERSADRWLLRVPVSEVENSIVLTARLAASCGAVALVERHPRGAELAGDPTQTELAATALGFGVLLLEASYLYSKSCGGPSVQRGTALGADELAVLVALSLAREEHSAKAALAELGTTQRALLREALAVVDESPGLVRLLREKPERVARGDFRLRDRGSFFARWFGKKPTQASAADREALALQALERGASVDELAELVAPLELPAAPAAKPARSGEDAELRSLVDDALREAREARAES